jgi:hypothetical protein
LRGHKFRCPVKGKQAFPLQKRELNMGKQEAELEEAERVV